MFFIKFLISIFDFDSAPLYRYTAAFYMGAFTVNIKRLSVSRASLFTCEAIYQYSCSLRYIA